ncbi:hypothetical protein CDL15_Pgr018896 [Punica granatum]|uniref:Uncharacterized protein n=1 Tax=Punica granatum TaxID=22663 RepID=A0A218WMG1_PUNGR|nr:hypothetical protein CDL15_Pgr018896 [Punica granatum]
MRELEDVLINLFPVGVADLEDELQDASLSYLAAGWAGKWKRQHFCSPLTVTRMCAMEAIRLFTRITFLTSGSGITFCLCYFYLVLLPLQLVSPPSVS